MKRNWLIIAVFVLALALIGLVVRAKFFAKTAPGALQISTTPKATVFLDGNQVGLTPFFNDKVEVGEHTVKLVPEATEDSLVPWEGKIQITSNILTVINRQLAAGEALASGEILSLEKIGQRNASSLAVVSVPDQAVVKIGGEPKGFAPVLVEDLTPGDYRVTISSPGFEERTISAHTVAGYKLTISAKLAQTINGLEEENREGEEEGEVEGEEDEAEGEEEAETTPTPTSEPETTPEADVTPPAKPYIRVKSTPNGWLRVREKPSTEDSAELTKIHDGEMYPYLEEEENGWYKIEYETDEEGWVSGVYVELVE